MYVAPTVYVAPPVHVGYYYGYGYYSYGYYGGTVHHTTVVSPMSLIFCCCLILCLIAVIVAAGGCQDTGHYDSDHGDSYVIHTTEVQHIPVYDNDYGPPHTPG